MWEIILMIWSVSIACSRALHGIFVGEFLAIVNFGIGQYTYTITINSIYFVTPTLELHLKG